jgi:hypothetical protein
LRSTGCTNLQTQRRFSSHTAQIARSDDLIE